MPITLRSAFDHSLDIPVKFWTFPGGERGMSLDTEKLKAVGTPEVHCHFRGSDDIVDLIMVTNAIRQELGSAEAIFLSIPYFPFARQDRVSNPGEPNALQAFVAVVNSLNFTVVSFLDPHSDVLEGLLTPGTALPIRQWEIWTEDTLCIPDSGSGSIKRALISPDAGAAKKTHKVASALGVDVIQAHKLRDTKTGAISGTWINEHDLTHYQRLIVVDDICDGGRTFIELAEVIRRLGYKGQLDLAVTHGIFSKGVAVVHEHFDNIFVINSFTAE